MFGKSRILLVVFVICVFFSGFDAADEAKTYKIGVLAKRGTERCLAKWAATADYLTETIENADFEIVPLGYEQIYPAVEADEVDFVIANPSFYVNLETKYDAGRIATLKNLRRGKVCTTYGGVMFTKAGSDINKLIDLKGKRFMGAGETSFGGWQMAWWELKARGIDPHKDFADLQFGGTHDAVAYAVRDGKADAGVVRTDTLERMAVEGKIDIDDYKILFGHDVHNSFLFAHSTRLYPEWPFAKTAETPDEIAEKVTAALLSMSADSDAAKAARCAGWTIPHNYAPVHDCLRELRIAPYENYGKITIAELVRQYWPWLLGAAGGILTIVVFAIRTRRLNIKLAKTIILRKQAEEKFRTLYEFSGDAIMMLDEKGFFDCNEMTVKLFGCRNKEEVCLKHPADLSPAVQPDGCDSMDYARNNIAIALKEGSYQFEHLHRRLDGTEFLADVLLNAMEIDGKRVLQAIVRDITERKQAEDEIKNLAKFPSENPNPVLRISKDGEVLYSNEAGNLLLAKWKSAIGKTVPEKWRNIVAEAFASGKGTEEEEEEEVKGEVFSFTIAPVKEAGYANLYARDITERKQAEAELVRLATIAEQAGEGIATTDMNGIIQFVNQAWAGMHGYEVTKELIGKHLSMFHTEEQIKTEVIPFNEQAKRTGCHAGEVGHARKDGTMFPTQMITTTLKDGKGEPIGLIGFVTDITDRKQAEELLRESEGKQKRLHSMLRLMCDNLPELIWSKDLKSRFLFANKACCEDLINARDANEPIGKDDIFFAEREKQSHPENPDYHTFGETCSSSDEAVLKSLKTIRTEEAGNIKGRFVVLDVLKSPLWDEKGRITGTVGCARDITRDKEMETERKQAEERIQQYQGRLKALAFQLTIAEEKERRRIAEDLHDNVGQSLAFARMQLASAQKIVSGEKLVSMMENLTESLLQASQDTRNVIFDLSSPVMNELGLAAAIPEWLEVQIGNQHGLKTEFIDKVDDSDKNTIDKNVRAILFRNVRELLTNVVKHAQADKVSVYLEQANNNVKIIVQDDGVGFDSREANEGVNRKGSFGLFSIQERMKDLGGSLEVVSEPGKGCKTVLTMPLGN